MGHKRQKKSAKKAESKLTDSERQKQEALNAFARGQGSLLIAAGGNQAGAPGFIAHSQVRDPFRVATHNV